MADYIDAFPGRKINLNNRPYLYFGGTSYLGLQTDTSFQGILIRNIQKYGTNYGASRQSNIRFSIYEKAESYLAELAQSEACLTLSSGYLAGQFICHHFNTKDYAFFYSPNAHAALYRSKIKPYATFTALNIAIREHLASPKRKVPVVLMDSIDFSGCNYPNFEGLRSLPLEDIVLIVDDSHGIGVVGDKGGGVHPVLSSLNTKELLVCCSLGKGLGVQAGAVFGSEKRILKLRDTAFFGGASPASPASVASLVEGHHLYPKKRKLLASRIELFLDTLENCAPFSFMAQHPAFSYSDKKLTAHLKDNYIVATSFNYPEQDTSTMHRLVLSAAHTKKDVEYLAKVVNSYHSL